MLNAKRVPVIYVFRESQTTGFSHIFPTHHPTELDRPVERIAILVENLKAGKTPAFSF